MNHLNVDASRARFDMGAIRATPGALKALQESGQIPSDFLARHANADWGALGEADRQMNDEALQDGSRIFSAYHTLKGVKIWIITDAVNDDGRRLSTTILLPNEY